MFVETIKICLKATEHKSKRTYANLTGKTCKAFLRQAKEGQNKGQSNVPEWEGYHGNLKDLKHMLIVIH